MATANCDTYTEIDVDTPAGKKFLRRVARNRGEGWRLRAMAPGWKIEFSRDVAPGAPGDSRTVVTVETNAEIARLQWNETDTGEDLPPETARITCSETDTRTAARLMADGWRPIVRRHSGSDCCREAGLAFADFGLMESTGGEVTISTTVYQNGRVLLRCAAVPD